MRFFLDTNVLIAASMEDHEHHARALPLLNEVHRKNVEGYTSAHALLEVYSILTRLPRAPRMVPIQVTALIEENILKHLKIISLSAKEYADLVLRLGRQSIFGGSAYDALHLACAQKCDADRVYTFNQKHFQALATDEFRERIVAP